MAGDGSGGSGGAPPLRRGLVVFGGRNEQGTQVLATLDAVTGGELYRAPVTDPVVAVAHDSAPGRDLWFVFTATEFPPQRDGSAVLLVGSVDEESGGPVIIETFVGLPPPIPGNVAVLNDRIAYLSYRMSNAVPVPWITILDTRDPRDVQVLDYAPTFASGEERIGLIGTRGTPSEPGALGGVLNVVARSNCDDITRACDLVVRPIEVGSRASDLAAHRLARYRGKPAFAAAQSRRNHVFVVPSLVEGGRAMLHVAPPERPAQATTLTLPTTASVMGDLAIAECDDATVFTTTDGDELHAVSNSGVHAAFDLMRPGQFVVYEPLTRSVVAPFNPGLPPDGTPTPAAPELAAFTVTSDRLATSLALERRTWAAPADLYVQVIAAQSPVPYRCR